MTLPRHRPRWLLSVLLLLGILCSGCVITAVYPFYHARDTYFDPDLVGDWMVNDSATERWRFERLTPTGNSYRLTAIDLADPSGKTDS